MASQVQSPILPANPNGNDFRYFKRQIENYLAIIAADDKIKLPILLNALGHDGTDIYDGLPSPKSTYDEAMNHLDDYFEGKSSTLLKRKRFFQTSQSSNESITEFACRLRRLSKDCNFGGTAPTMLRDIFVIGVKDDFLGERLLAEDDSLTFEDAICKAEAFDRARSERQTVGARGVSPISTNFNHNANSNHNANFNQKPNFRSRFKDKSLADQMSTAGRYNLQLKDGVIDAATEIILSVIQHVLLKNASCRGCAREIQRCLMVTGI